MTLMQKEAMQAIIDEKNKILKEREMHSTDHKEEPQVTAPSSTDSSEPKHHNKQTKKKDSKKSNKDKKKSGKGKKKKGKKQNKKKAENNEKKQEETK